MSAVGVLALLTIGVERVHGFGLRVKDLRKKQTEQPLSFIQMVKDEIELLTICHG